MTIPGIQALGLEDWAGLPSIASLTATVCGLMRVDPPALASEPPLEEVVDGIARQVGGRRIEKCLIYCPDALGEHVWRGWPGRDRDVARLAPLEARLRSVSPPKTPVCYASIFTGAAPDAHGIRRYERPVLGCDTLYDAFLRAGKRTTISAVAGSSIDLIFRGRDVRYLSGAGDEEVTTAVLLELAEDRCDLVVAYHQEYDDLLHETEPFSEACSRAMVRHVESFAALVDAARRAWSGRDAMVVFAPDHGAHVNPETERGDHGEDIPDDMLVRHWYGALSAG